MSSVSALIDFLSEQIGKPYLLGAEGPDAYDCSSLVQKAFLSATNIELPRTSTDQYTSGVNVERNELEPGDIVFFDTGWTERKPNHCGVYIGGEKFINANSYNGSVKEERLDSNYWSGVYYGARRVLSESGLGHISGGHSASSGHTDSGSTSDNDTLPFQLGNSGDHITQLQEILLKYHYLDSPSSVSENYDAQTSRAVKFLQLSFEVYSSSDTLYGVYDVQTANVLESLSAPFSDVALSHAFCPAIMWLSHRNIIQGYAGGLFKPDRSINRAEALKIILLAFEVVASSHSELPFSDVPKESWFYEFVKTAYNNKLVEGYNTPEGKIFKPESEVTRAEASKIILSCANIPLIEDCEGVFEDSSREHWYFSCVCTAYKYQMLLPLSPSTIEPNTPITRAELCHALVRALVHKRYSL